MKKYQEPTKPKISTTTMPQQNRDAVTCRTWVETFDYESRCKLSKFIEDEYQELCDMKQFPNLDISSLNECTLQELHDMAEELETMYRKKLGINK